MNRLVLTVVVMLVLAAPLFSCATGTPGTQSSATTYAAIAVVPGKGQKFHGYAKRESAAEAKRAALKKCPDYDCIVVHVYLSDQCVHIVLGDDQIYWNTGTYTPQRRQDIIDRCERIDENCQVIVSECLP